MSHRQPTRVADIHRFDSVIDARSPAEYALDHIPGAINCPVLDNEERRIVGTLFKQTGAFEARRIGGAMVAANLARHLRDQFAEKPESWKPLIYCWRGGLRSGSMVTWMRMVGWDAQQLAGGYKAYRHHVIETIDAVSSQLPLTVVTGATGSAKTRVLQAMERQGAQVLDLEHAAQHKGSLLGDLPGVAQPSQKHFDTRLATALARFDLSRPVFVEGESARIGRLSLPLSLVARMRASPCVEIDATIDARLSYLLRDYAYLGHEPEVLANKIGHLKELQGKEAVARWQAWAREGALPPLFSELMTQHYDPHYGRSQARHFAGWNARLTVVASDLSDEGIEALAREVIEVEAGRRGRIVPSEV